jgi:hypothetical protein
MSLNPMYIVAPSLQTYFVDKDTGYPNAGGKVFFYRDTSRTTPKPVYTLQNNAGNYTYVPLANPLILSSVGTPVDASGQDIVIYWYPFDTEGNLDLYYVVVQDNLGVPQFVRQAWPNPNIDENSAVITEQNFIPNGQLLAHTILADNELLPGVNVIAQGGFEIVLDAGATSTNTLSWIELPYTNNPPQSPRYEANWACTNANPLEVLKDFRIFFYDVNKFSAPPADWTFAFWSQANAITPFTLKVIYNFGVGGSAQVTQIVEAGTIGTAPTFQNFVIPFQSNSGFNIGPNQGDFVAIDISIPTDITFNIKLTDFVLLNGSTAIIGFPVQTNADMIARGIFGWTDLPNPDGAQLGLSPVLTRYGMAWDGSDIGDLFMSLGPVPSPTGSTAISNKMPLNGASYVTSASSYYGIPFSRLGAYMLASSPVTNVPLAGTGANYATAYTFAGVNSLLRLTVNSAGASSTAASDGDTGWAIGGVVTYGTSTTGSASITYNAYNTVANTVLAIGQFATPNAAVGAGTSGFTVTTLNSYSGLLAQQNLYAFSVLTVAESALANPSSTGKYFTFSNATTDYYMWFQVTNESDPTVGSRTGIKINLAAGQTAQDVANLVREAMNAFQISTIAVGGVPSGGQYWLFSTNPASQENFYVWYTVAGVGTDPMIANRTGIEVELTNSETAATVVTKTQLAINSYQYAVPNYAGMFPRGYDPTGIWDFDVAMRLSSVTGISGANLGTFEYPQFDSHTHVYTNANVTTLVGEFAASGSKLSIGADVGFSGTNLSNTGGSETRPVNFFVNFYTRY